MIHNVHRLSALLVFAFDKTKQKPIVGYVYKIYSFDECVPSAKTDVDISTGIDGYSFGIIVECPLLSGRFLK